LALITVERKLGMLAIRNILVFLFFCFEVFGARLIGDTEAGVLYQLDLPLNNASQPVVLYKISADLVYFGGCYDPVNRLFLALVSRVNEAVVLTAVNFSTPNHTEQTYALPYTGFDPSLVVCDSVLGVAFVITNTPGKGLVIVVDYPTQNATVLGLLNFYVASSMSSFISATHTLVSSWRYGDNIEFQVATLWPHVSLNISKRFAGIEPFVQTAIWSSAVQKLYMLNGTVQPATSTLQSLDLVRNVTRVLGNVPGQMSYLESIMNTIDDQGETLFVANCGPQNQIVATNVANPANTTRVAVPATWSDPSSFITYVSSD